VFEIAKTGGSYASTPTTLVSFNGTNGAAPGGLIADAAGNFFGTTSEGGANGFGTVFELVNNGGGSYTLTTLVSFNGTNGANPTAGLIADAAGNLFGTTFGRVPPACSPLLGDVGALRCGTVFEITGSGFVIRPQLIYAKQADFNADGKGDILWRYIGGTVAEWLMHADGTFIPVGGQAIPNEWQIAGTGDFNHDGTTDILWRCIDATSATCTDGQVAIWLMNANGSVNQSIGGPVIPTGWTIVGTGDFNGDGKTDILWRYIDGTVGIWFMNGGTVSSTAEISGVSAGWTIVGTGDFNHDGISDILWRCTDVTFNPPCTNGTVGEWLMNSNGTVKQFAGGQLVSTGWTIVGTGDFNGDGTSDILWRCTDATSVACTNGTVAIWMMNADGTVKQFAGGQVVPTGWTIAGTGDFNGDGISDILWRCTDLASADCTNGTVGEWLMNANGTVNQYVGDQVIPSSWAIIE
jgi:uncharacterized repeat protein (TIGR03803 family)